MQVLCDIAFILTMIALIIVNFRTLLLPNVITLPGFVISVIAHSALVRTQPDVLAVFQRVVASPVLAAFFDSLTGAFVAGGALWLLNVIWKKVRGAEVIGFGDVKMMAMIGAYLGTFHVLGVLALSTILIVVFSTIVSALRKTDSPFPSGSFWGAPAILFTIVSSSIR